MLNSVVLIGRVCREVDLRFTTTGKAVAKFAIAVDRAFKSSDGEKQTDFINIVVWNKQAENCAEYLGKGKMCAVKGLLQIRQYEAQDGSKRTAAEVVAESVRFLSPKGEGGQQMSGTIDLESLQDAADSEDLPF